MPRTIQRRCASWPGRILRVATIFTAACSGVLVDPGSNSESPGSAGTRSDGDHAELEAFAAAPGAFKRLTTSEYLATVRDLFGDVVVGDLEPDTFVEGFAKVGSSRVSISLHGVEKYEQAAESVTEQVFRDPQRRAAFLGCTPNGVSDVACFSSFVNRFGRLAFRRPLTAAESKRYGALASTIAVKLNDPVAALRLTTKALLLSPYFLYRTERGAPDPSSSFWRLTSHELATSLAYFLTNTTPDAELLAAADRDELSSVTALRAHAERLLAGPRGRESVANFATELFRLTLIGNRAKDPGLFPEYTTALQAAMAREIPAMLQNLVFEQRRSVLDLFTTRSTFVNAELAELYGIDAGALTSRSWVAAELPETGLRAGLLGTSAFLSLNANQKEGSPTHRGKFIRQYLLCQKIPDPPPDVSTVIEDPPPGVVLTKREKLSAHREDSACAGCHALMDPMGLTLENFDAIGAFRETEHGLSIDISGDFDGVPFHGPVELGKLLAESPLAAECLVKNLYRYATGRTWSGTQTRVVAALGEKFAADGYDLQKLMIELVTSDGFRFVAPPG